MILVHTDYGRALMESLSMTTPGFNSLFFLRRENLAIGGAGEYYEQIKAIHAGLDFLIDVRYSYDEDRVKVIESIELFDSNYTKLLTAIEIRVPVTAGSFTYKDDSFYLSGAADRLDDDGGDDFVDLGAGNDVYHYMAGNDRILGNLGTDLVMITALREDVTFERAGLELTAKVGEHTVQMNSVERVQLHDGMLVLDVAGWQTGGGVYRLYQAAFDRTPDGGGLKNWIDHVDAGHGDLKWVANQFILSQEFQETYGTPDTVSNAAFVDLLYQNVLDRPAEGAGADYWVQSLGAGMERAHVLLSFSESAENQAKVAPAIHDGFWY